MPTFNNKINIKMISSKKENFATKLFDSEKLPLVSVIVGIVFKVSLIYI
jgi:hypothetical protein